MKSIDLANLICEAIDEKKGYDIVKIAVTKLTTLCDYFIVASGNSTANVKAIAEHLEEKLSKKEIEVKRMEGQTEGRWIAMDYGDVIVHIFNDETRHFYHLENFWEKGVHTKYEPKDK